MAATEGNSRAAGAEMLDGVRLAELLQASETLRTVSQDPERFRAQVVVGLVLDNADGQPTLTQIGFRADAEYFYPASTVKLFAAVATLEQLARLRRETGLAIDADTGLAFYPLFPEDQFIDSDPSNLEDQRITSRHEIRKIFLVSDNEAFNRLYDLVGQDGLFTSALRAGLPAVRIVHRLSISRSAEENRRLPRIDLVGNEFRYPIAARTTQPLPAGEPSAGLLIGSGYWRDGQRIDAPMDFSSKNRISLVDLQRALCMVVRGDVDCGGPGFTLRAEDRVLLRETMVQYPRQSDNPRYDAEEYPDDYVKLFLPGLARVVDQQRLRIYNKLGQAYGFTTENAWIVDEVSERGFFLTATLYTNEDGILNDDQYEYEEIAVPYFAELGEAVARELWQK